MLTKITLVVALCSGVTMEKIQARLVALRGANPGAEVSVRIDKKAQCYQGHVLTGKDARLLEQIGK